MDDRRFDSLARSLARGASRRSLLKSLLGLGGAVTVSGTLLEGSVEAARRSTPTPEPVHCPGNQRWNDKLAVCECSPGLTQCVPNGPACCNDGDSPGTPEYSECCDNACCVGHCYGEELCCPYPRTFCETTQECCPIDQPYCCGDGCCATPCCDTSAGSVCCEGDTPKCCSGDICIPSGGCCTDAECQGCQSCENHICVDDRANCPGGVAGCDDCVAAECVPNSGYCDDGNACTSNTCGDGGVCSNPFYCTSDDCCSGNPAGPVCDTQSGTCYKPCVAEGESCSDDSDCCEGSCWGVDSGSVCFICLPDGTPCGFPPFPNICDHCCSNTNALGFCI